MPDRRVWVGVALLFAALTAVYSNHFQNGFHFDDWHTVTQNPFIRDLRNLPQFFTDTRTMSVLPANQAYRPVVTASLALDYWIGKGLNPVAFHASTFFWYVCLVLGLLFLYKRIVGDYWAALFGAAWFALHPVSAETVNYVVQRADLYVALGMVVGLLLFASNSRFYLVPVLFAALCKPTAITFPALVFLYCVLCHESRVTAALKRALPSIATAAGLTLVHSWMTPPTFTSSNTPWFNYVITQPIVTARYFISWFLPIGLSADTDRKALESLWSAEALAGILFLAVLLACIVSCARRERFRAIGFGLAWFLVTLVPVALMPLAEVENDHRMFLPVVGLSLAAAGAAALGMQSLKQRGLLTVRLKSVTLAASVALLGVYGAGAHARNRVWLNEETLWHDVTQKSPRNGRGLMNYGLTQMEKGRYNVATQYFERALAYTPHYFYLHINLGIARGAQRNHAAAERHFARAIELAPADALPRYYYGRYLKTQARIGEAVDQLRAAITLNPLQTDARSLLMQAYAEGGRWTELQAVASESLRLVPNDTIAAAWLARSADLKPRTPEDWLAASLTAFQSGRYRECINAARESLRLRPGYAEAWNNIAAGHQALREWDQAIAAAQRAVQLRPDFQLARNNLAWSQQQKLAFTASP